MTRRIAIASGLAAALLAGCVTSPEPTADEVQAQALGHVTVPQAWANKANAAPVEAGWLSTFGDAQLDALVAEAIEHNPDLAMAAARVEQAEAQVDLAAAQLKPAIGILGRAGSKPVSDLIAMLSGVVRRQAASSPRTLASCAGRRAASSRPWPRLATVSAAPQRLASTLAAERMPSSLPP